RGRPRGREGPRRLDRPGRAIPLPGTRAPLRRSVAFGLRPRRRRTASRARLGVSRDGAGPRVPERGTYARLSPALGGDVREELSTFEQEFTQAVAANDAAAIGRLVADDWVIV